MKEWGFWEYTTPGAGPCPHYESADWLHLLDDMAAAGMNSLLLMIKWHTTGYRSRFEWLDQPDDSRAIASDNALLREVMAAAGQRGIRVWLGAVCSHFQVKEFGIVPPDGRTTGSFAYDADYPGVQERAAAMFAEIAELFPTAHGLLVEMESVEFDWPHRVASYNDWAAANDRPLYAELRQQPIDARAYQKHDWRDYLTMRRCAELQAIGTAVRETGYDGQLSMILESASELGAYQHAVDIEQYAQSMPGWAAVTYDYHRNLNRGATIDFCMTQPLAAGLPTWFLGRGVMTYHHERLTIPLAENWRRDAEDALAADVDGLWYFGVDALPGDKNFQCAADHLQAMGYADGLAARRALLDVVSEYDFPRG